MKKHKYISRIDHRHTHGYQVRICYQSSSITHSKMFSDDICGGKRKALKAAIKFRHQIVKDLGIEYLLNVPNRAVLPLPRRSSKHSSSGIVGIVYATNYKNGKKGSYWGAKYQINKKQHGKYFAVSVYGEKAAFKWACITRYERAGKLYVYRNVQFPCKIPVPFEYIG